MARKKKEKKWIYIETEEYKDIAHTNKDDEILRQLYQKSGSYLEAIFLDIIISNGLPRPTVQFHIFNWRCDFVWLDRECFLNAEESEAGLIVEVQGGTWSGGRHVRGAAYSKDALKYNTTQAHGFNILLITSDHLRTQLDETISLVKKVYENRKKIYGL